MKYKAGDTVKVVNYGHLIWQRNLNLEIVTIDIAKDVVGQIGVIEKATSTQGIPQYSINGISGKQAWYDEGQLQKVE